MSYVLVDIENLTQGARATPEELRELWRGAKTQLGITPAHHVVIGAGRLVARKYRRVIPDANVKWVIAAQAPDGADRALLAAIDLRRVAHDYDQLIIVSGDHIFTDLVIRAQASGLSVKVGAVRASRPVLSRKLAAAADTCCLVARDGARLL